VQKPGRSPLLVKVGVVIFALGLLAVAAIFGCFVAGLHDLPLWLNVSAGAGVPLGLALGLIGLVREARKEARVDAAREAAQASEADPAGLAADELFTEPVPDPSDPAPASSDSSAPNPVKSDSTKSAPAARS
jgi:hypothetical protein